ncbi:hypothetical protein IHE44_0001520, partial [Lamprotornis superbus]
TLIPNSHQGEREEKYRERKKKSPSESVPSAVGQTALSDRSGWGEATTELPAEMAENWKNCFEEELICPICLHVFVEPVQLPCKHNFCRGCIGEAWAKESGLVRCPECNQAYNQKPNLEKNLKLTNIVEKFNSLNLEKPPSVLHCVFCRRGPPLPAQKICLRCEAPCCQSHVQTHLQQPSTARGHLLVEAEDVRAWSCPQHNAYRLYHCEAEQVAVCQFCCYYSGAHQGHSVCDVEIRRNEIRGREKGFGVAYGSTREVVMSRRSLLVMGDGPQNGAALLPEVLSSSREPNPAQHTQPLCHFCRGNNRVSSSTSYAGAFSLPVASWEKAPSLLNHVGRASVGSTDAHKMLMKQQDRLEEREQDIEEQLYKLESDKRLVEVTSASPCYSQSRGLSPYGIMGTSSWDIGTRWARRKADMQGRMLSVIILGDKMCLELLCGLMGPGLSWDVRNKAILKYQMAYPVLSSAQPFSERECLWSLKPFGFPEHEGKGSGTWSISSLGRAELLSGCILGTPLQLRISREKVSQLKDEVRLQYEKMHQILDEDLRKTMEILDKAQAKFCNENAAQVLHLNERMQEAKKLLSSVQVMFDKTEDINFMKNTKSVKILMDSSGVKASPSRAEVSWDGRAVGTWTAEGVPWQGMFKQTGQGRTQNCTGGSLPPPKIGHLNSKLFLNEIAKKEKQLRKLLEGPLSTPVPFLQSIPMYPCTVSNSSAEKRKHSTAFPEGSFLEPSSGTVASQYMSQGASAGEGQSAQAMVPCSSTQHIVGLPSGPQPVHSGSVFNPSHYSNTTSSQQSVLSQYGGRKILVCSVDNCYCSSVSNHSGHQPYPRSGHFPWTVSSQEYSHPLPPAPAVPQSLPGLAVREWIDASQQHGRQDFYRVYGQPSAKHYVTS